MITIRPAREEDAAHMVDILAPIIEAGTCTILPPVSLQDQIEFIRADNEQGAAFYKGLGFRVIGTARDHARVDGRYADEILTEKLL